MPVIAADDVYRFYHAREDETRALTWYSEEEALRLLGDAGFCDLRTEPLAWSREGGRHFAVRGKA